MNKFLSSDPRSQELQLKQFHIRKKAKLCVCILYTLQLLYRSATLMWDQTLTPKARLMAYISLPFSVLMPAIVAVEYFLFKKKGPVVVKYSNLVDLLLLMCFLGDWITSLCSGLSKIQQTNPPSFKVSVVYGCTSFSWRTLMVVLLIQKWQIKIIAPVVATLVVTGYTLHYDPGNMAFMIVRTCLQCFNIILIVYIDDKVKWGLMRTNFEQEKWMQVNNFILDSIPENVMILDFSGEARFTSEYCKSYMKNNHLSPDDPKAFFKKVHHLIQQQDEPLYDSKSSALQMERLTTCHGLCLEFTENESNFLKFENLENLIDNFPSVIREKRLEEKHFVVYNGKFKMEHGQERSIEVKISFVQHFKDDYIILLFRDTTQRDLLVTLQETNKYKDQLLASVSHELRAPLNGNINLVESAINSPEIPESVKETLLIPALRSSKFLLHIINDILDMSQIKEKKLRLVFQSDDLKETLKDTVQLVELQAKKKGLEFLVDLDPKLPRHFCTDHLRLSQIVLNLLTNAIKFTNQGIVKLTAARIAHPPNHVKISIEDSGIGISRENIKKIFSSYAIIDFDEREKMNPTGVGLGLNITSHLVQMLAPENHKNIIVSSTPKQGSTFTFILENKPLEHSKEPDNSSHHSDEIADEIIQIPQPRFLKKLQHFSSSNSLPSALEQSESRSELLTRNICSCPKVLIIDDNPFNIMALETILNSIGIKNESVFSGSAAIEKLLTIKANICGSSKQCRAYSIIFMDQEMPEMSGSETVQEIKRLQNEGLVPSRIKIIGCTAHKAKEEVDKFVASGLDHCIFKPVSRVMISDVLRDFL